MKYLLKGQETERLKFRLLQPEDFDSWMKLFKARNVASFLGLDPTLSEYELCKLWFERGSYRYENDLGGMNVLIEKSTGHLVGQSGLLVQTVEDIERLEVGYSILPEFWGRGFASEAAAKCKDYAFGNDLTDSLISIIHIDNIGSERVALKNGMAWEKKLDPYNGNPVNIFRIDKKNRN